MKKRILHCAYSGLGGHAAVLFTLLDESMQDEFDHFVLFFGVEDLRPEYAEACRSKEIPFVFVKKRGRVALGSHAEVLRTIRRICPDIVMINGTSLATPILSLQALLRDNCSIVVRETQANQLKSRQEWLGSFMAARYADAVIYLTEDHRREVDERIGGVAQSVRSHIIPNGIDLDEFDFGSVNSSGPLRLSMVSRLVSIKDHLTLIKAIEILVFERELPLFEVTIAGEGPTESALRSLVEATGLSSTVTLPGLLTRSEVADLLRRTDVYVHCTFGETMSNSILQAMASRLPVVASDVPGVVNMIRDREDGILVPVKEPRILADVIEMLLRSPTTRRELGNRARMRVRTERSQQKMVQEYRHLFAKLTDSRAL